MPSEYGELKNKIRPIARCPTCGCSFKPFMRGQVQSWWRRLLGRRYCAVICSHCKEVVGWERP